MRTTYAVVWREGDDPVVSGRLELGPGGVKLDGSIKGQPSSREIPYENLSEIRIGRSSNDRVDGRSSLVLERRAGQAIRVASVAQPGIVAELAERLAALQIAREGATQRIVVILPLKEGGREAARALLEQGPPFDPERTQLERHSVFLTERLAVFLFEFDGGTAALEELLTEPDLWTSAAAWRECLAGPPALAEDVYSWTRSSRGGFASCRPHPAVDR